MGLTDFGNGSTLSYAPVYLPSAAPGTIGTIPIGVSAQSGPCHCAVLTCHLPSMPQNILRLQELLPIPIVLLECLRTIPGECRIWLRIAESRAVRPGQVLFLALKVSAHLLFRTSPFRKDMSAR